ncbi:ribonuclease R [Feifania hominis]|uniref:Ribonuclease R n=1 Tax=Feifania hominis TaxID=2763660 RepID=A0A926HUU7_9FIRM|nr:ribonuclease R [Feifania hominis]MBC8536673.1 ribonuclease R [Feifania hominis]
MAKIKKRKQRQPERRDRLIEGTFEATPRGFGFVVPDEPDGERLFVPGAGTHGAMHTDRVEARVVKPKTEERSAEGEITRVLQRNVTSVTGTLESDRGRRFYAVPDDPRYGEEIEIKKGELMGAKRRDKVLVALDGYNSRDNRYQRGRVTANFGPADTLGANYRSVLHDHSVRMEFPDEVKAEAARLFSRGVPESELEGRLDLRGETVFTIDGADAKDFDDAISIEKTAEGYTLGVHIADVSHYVTKNSAIDAEAFARGTSIYFTDQVVPMLPFELSNELCSLKPGVDRLTLSCIMQLDAAGKVVGHTIRKSVIRSVKRCVYGEVNAVLGGTADEPTAGSYESIRGELLLMRELAGLLTARRRRRGALNFETVESQIVVDENAEPVDIVPRERGESERIIEEFMLLANETVAEHLCRRRLPCVYRVHEKPDPEKVQSFLRVAGALGLHARLVGGELCPKGMQSMLEQAAGKPFERVISNLLIRSMMKAKYSAENLGHFGIAAKYYCHFTSPIRRYPDLAVHRILTAMETGGLDGRKAAFERFAEAAAEQSTECEIRALEAERDIEDLYKALYMAKFVGEEFDGFVSSVTGFGLFVELPNTVEGLVHISDLDDDYYVFDEEKLRLTGERGGRVFALGDPIRVRLVRSDITARQIDFVPV